MEDRLTGNVLLRRINFHLRRYVQAVPVPRTTSLNTQERSSGTGLINTLMRRDNCPEEPPLIYHYIFSKQVFASCICMYDVCVISSPLCVLPLAVSTRLLSCSFTRAACGRRVRSLWGWFRSREFFELWVSSRPDCNRWCTNNVDWDWN